VTASAIYRGVVTHLRVRPRRHALRYRMFQLLIDLDEGPALGRARCWFGFDRPALLSFRQSDHGDGSSTPLKDQVHEQLRAAGIVAGGPVRLLCMPRVLGFVFNPLSVFFCHRRDGSLAAIVYEVNNTFGDRYSYVLAVTSTDPVSHSCAKRLHVSPFMDMGLTYDFRIDPPDDTIGIGIHVRDADGPWLAAGFSAARRPFTDAELMRAWLAQPLLTIGVVAGIHWEALKLWLKGVKVRPNPKAPARASCPAQRIAG
jgi:uncharacterized protein